VSVRQRLARWLFPRKCGDASSAGGGTGTGSDPQFRLGETCRFSLPPAPPGVSRRVFLRQGRILYPQPIAEVPASGAIELFPEAPGRYALTVQSVGTDGSIDWTEIRFQVWGTSDELGPRLVAINDQTNLWTPSAWEGMGGHEWRAIERLRRVVKPGAVVYDIGAHLGLYTIALARLAGPAGHVYCLDPNPLCVYFLNTNLELNQVQNVDVLPVAIIDRTGSTELTINYRNLQVGLVSEAPIRKPGHRITVPAAGLDELIATHRLRPPTFLKIDIEGAEVVAVDGMKRTIADHRPVLFIELHGRDAASRTLRSLAGARYTYTETASGRVFPDADSLGAWFPDACLQVIGEPGLQGARGS
jgi:FkbM family methyltransferase